MAAYTQLTLDDITRLCGSYSITPVTSSLMSGGMTNSSYKIVDEAHDTYILTVLNSHSFQSAAQLVDTLAYLGQLDFPAEKYQLRTDEHVLSSWEDKPVLIKPFIEGTPLHLCQDIQAAEIGDLLGRLHTLPAPHFLPLKTRRIMPNWRSILEEHPCDDLKATLENVESLQSIFNRCRSEPVLCHGDLFMDNLIRNTDRQITVIDWETASCDAPLLDLGVTTTAIRLHKRDACPLAEISEMCEAYNERRRLGYTISEVLEASTYTNAHFALMRFVRHNITHPDKTQAKSYRDLLTLPTPF